MKILGFRMPAWYEMIYIAVAIATFKHSSWAYSITMEGAAPQMDWASWSPTMTGFWDLGGFLMWFFWGGLMAVAIDVSMFFASREIRRGNRFHIFTFAIAAFFSAATQLMYASTHAVELDYISSSLGAIQPETGWLWFVSEYRIVYLPISLPITAVIYTTAIMFSGTREVAPGVLKQDEEDEQEEKFCSAREAAQVTGRNYQYVLQLCKKGVVGRRAEDGVTWELSISDLRKLDRGGIHKNAVQSEGEQTSS